MKSKKQITIMLGIILALPLVFAMIAGTNQTIEFSGDVKDCYIINNQSDLIGLSFVEDGSNVILSTDVRYKPDTFSVSCLVKGQRIIADEEEEGDGGYYTYPWRNKVNATEANETTPINYTEVLEEINETTFEEEVEEPEPKNIWIISGVVALLLIIVGVILYNLVNE